MVVQAERDRRSVSQTEYRSLTHRERYTRYIPFTDAIAQEGRNQVWRGSQPGYSRWETR